MGGPINFVHRDDAGKVSFRGIYTGGMYTLQGSRLVKEKKDFSHLLKEWYGDEDIYDSTKIAPGGYGLFVIDYFKDEMYSIQGYCGIGSYYCDPYQKIGYRDEEHEVVLEYLRKGDIKEVEYFDGKVRQSIKREADKPITEKMVMNINSGKTHRGNMTFTLDMSPIQCMEFSEDKRGYAKLKKHMISRGFQIDESEWKAFVKDSFDC
jgi:hypothetical protein